MAIVNLSKRTVGCGFEYTETIADGADGDTVLLPGISDTKRVTCTIIAGANTGKFQFTTSSDAAVLAGTCTWIDWPKEDITGTDYDLLLGPVTAVRGVSVSGEINIEIVR
jgi:hypothetical protein